MAVVDEAADDEHGGGEVEGGVAVPGAAVGAASELAVVGPPRVVASTIQRSPSVSRRGVPGLVPRFWTSRSV